jgi:hypothetical protein
MACAYACLLVERRCFGTLDSRSKNNFNSRQILAELDTEVYACCPVTDLLHLQSTRLQQKQQHLATLYNMELLCFCIPDPLLSQCLIRLIKNGPKLAVNSVSLKVATAWPIRLFIPPTESQSTFHQCAHKCVQDSSPSFICSSRCKCKTKSLCLVQWVDETALCSSEFSKL